MLSNDKKDEKEHDYFSNGSSAIKEKKLVENPSDSSWLKMT